MKIIPAILKLAKNTKFSHCWSSAKIVLIFMLNSSQIVLESFVDFVWVQIFPIILIPEISKCVSKKRNKSWMKIITSFHSISAHIQKEAKVCVRYQRVMRIQNNNNHLRWELWGIDRYENVHTLRNSREKHKETS